MRRMTLLVVSVVLAVGLFACSKSDNTSNSNSNSTTSEKPASSTPSTTAASSSGEKIGIAECDEYIAKYEACTSKVPEAGRAAYKSALDQTRASWKKLADNPTTRASLAAACKQATETANATWKMYGCN
jgi:hypothetical protein